MLSPKDFNHPRKAVSRAVAYLTFSLSLLGTAAISQNTDSSMPNIDGTYQPPPYQGAGTPVTQVPVTPPTNGQASFAPPNGQYQPQQAYNSPPNAMSAPNQYQGGYGSAAGDSYQSSAPPYGAPQSGQIGVNPPPNYGYQTPQYPASGYAQQQGYASPQQGYAPPQQGYPPQYGGQPYGAPQYRPGAQQAGVQYAQAGTVIPCQLRTSISTQVAKDGDYIEATTSQPIPLGGYSSIPAGSVVSGQVANAESGRRLSRSGALSIAFNQLRLPNGVTVPITAHLSGGAGKYKENNQGEFRGEGGKAKLGQTAIRGGVGAGLGAALGTGLGAIAGGGHGAGMGAWSGAAIGGGLGVGDMLLRKGRDVVIPSGTSLNVELDQPAAIPDVNGTVQQPATQGVF